MRMRYEHMLASGKTLEELSDSMTYIANIRNDELSELSKKGYDVFIGSSSFFSPVGELSFVDGMYSQIMRRVIG